MSKNYGKAIPGEYLDPEKVPYCGSIRIFGYTDDDGNITGYEGDAGGHFDRDFTATWTIDGYRIDEPKSEDCNKLS